MGKKILTGQILTWTGNPFHTAWQDCVRHERQGAVVIDGGHIVSVGKADDILQAYPGVATQSYGDDLILPGFVDTHVHYPQTAIIASWGKTLVDWLNDYTFPEEMRLSDSAYANDIAGRYFDLALANGTTTMCSYATSAPVSVTAFMEQARARGLRAMAGKTCMDRNAPDGLCDTAQRGYDESKDLLQTWHGVERLGYVITPRFAPTSTPEQMDALGALWTENPDCLMQTHLSEQLPEIDWVKDLFPSDADYLAVYERFGLLGARGIYGHSIHLTDRERAVLVDAGAAISHCPTSNTFIGSGLCDLPDHIARGGRFGIATDTGGGSSFSMLRTMAASYEIAMLARQTPFHAAQLLWAATAGGADALHLGDKIGTLAPGFEADLVVLDLKSTPMIEQRANHADDFWEQVFPTIMMGDDRAIRDVWVGGARL